MAALLNLSVLLLLLMSVVPAELRSNPIKASESPDGQANTDFNHVQFAQTWTATICGKGGSIRCKNPLPEYYTNNFSMHGLWPGAATGQSLPPPGGKPTRVPDDLFKPIEIEMATWWANINSNQADHEFWWHEWEDHGVLGNWGENGALKYFRDGIKARQNIDLLSILKAGGISFNTNYTKPDIVSAISKRLPVTNLYISCSKQPGGLYYLFEILICLDKITHGYISCPVDTDLRRCNGEFQIPHS